MIYLAHRNRKRTKALYSFIGFLERLTIDLNKTPYLYYSFIIPEGSDFTFSIYSDTTYSPWLTFLDVTKGNAKLNSGAENWDALFFFLPLQRTGTFASIL